MRSLLFVYKNAYCGNSDPLSAVDAHVGQYLFDHAIKGALAGKTRIVSGFLSHFQSGSRG